MNYILKEMHWSKILLLLTTCCIAYQSIAPLKCSFSKLYGKVYLDIPFSNISIALQQKDKVNLYFKSTNIENNHSKEHRCWISLHAVEVLKCDMWSKSEHSSPGKRYTLEVINNISKKVVWDYGNKTFKPYEDLFYCFSDHNIQGPVVINQSQKTIEIEWKTSKIDEDNAFILYHNITVEYGGINRMVKQMKDGCHTKTTTTCSFPIESLEPCTKYKICIVTQFTMETRDKCTDTTTMCKNLRGTQSFPLEYIILSMLGVLLFLTITVILICYKNKKYERKRLEMITNYDLIFPREIPQYDEIPYVNKEDIYFMISKRDGIDMDGSQCEDDYNRNKAVEKLMLDNQEETRNINGIQ